MKIDKKDRPKVKVECLRLMLTFKLDPARMQLLCGFIDTYLNLDQQEEAIFQSELSTIDLTDQEQIMELTTSWEQKGIAKGLEQCLKQGLEQGQSNTILRQLNRKLGSIDDAIAEQIKSLNPEQLDSLTEDLLDFQSLGDLQTWLSNS